MKIIIILPVLLIITVQTYEIAAQSILQQYFNGNKDSLEKEAIRLINMPEPTFKPSAPAQIDKVTLRDMGFEQAYKTENYYFTMRDNRKLFAYRFPMKSLNTIILIHGVASSAYMYNKTAGLLQQATQSEVFAINLRGHGQSEGKAGDVDYINQYADDLSDIIDAIRKEKPNGKIILAGHSMGGGIILRFEMKHVKNKINGILLFSPLIGHNTPAIPKNKPAGNDSIEPFVKIHFARIIGLKMLNEIHQHQLDSLPVLFFNLPEAMPLRKYTFRANMSMAPENFVEGLKSVHVPMLVLMGSKDEFFSAEALKNAIIENSKGDVRIIEDATHNGIRHHSLSFDYINEWFSRL